MQKWEVDETACGKEPLEARNWPIYLQLALFTFNGVPCGYTSHGSILLSKTYFHDFALNLKKANNNNFILIFHFCVTTQCTSTVDVKKFNMNIFICISNLLPYFLAYKSRQFLTS